MPGDFEVDWETTAKNRETEIKDLNRQLREHEERISDLGRYINELEFDLQRANQGECSCGGCSCK